MPDTSRAPLADRLRQDKGFQLLAQSLPDALFVVDAEGVIAFADADAQTLLKLPPEAIEGLPFRDFVYESDLSALPAEFDVSKGGVWDVRLARPNGELTWANVALLSGSDTGVLDDGDKIVTVREVSAEGLPRDRAMLYRLALDSSNNLIVISDPTLPDNPIVFVNANFLKATGYEREEVLGRNCRFLQFRPDGTRDEDQPGFCGMPGLDALRKAIANGTPETVVLRNYRKNGEVFYNELHLTPVHDEDGEPIAFVGVQNDVTARVEAISALAARKEMLGAFYDGGALQMGIVESVDGTLIHRSANRAASALYGVESVEDLSPEALGFPPEEAARWAEHVDTCCDGGEPVAFETVLPWGASPEASGTRHFRVLISPIGEGPLYAYVMEDQTSQRALEMERRRLYAAVESLRDPVLITDATLDQPGPHIVYVNPAYTEVFGYEAHEVIGKTPRITQGPATDRSVLHRLRQKLEAGLHATGEVINYKKDGTPFMLRWEIAPIEDESGRITHFVATMRDVTDRRRLERAVFEATAREQERMARDLHDGLGQVLAGTRYALSAVAGTLKREEHAEAPTVRSAADQIGQALDQARSIAHGLLPTHLTSNDLSQALEDLAADVSQSYSVSCTFEGDLNVRQAPRSHHLYRIAQEATTNAVRHGRAQHIGIRLAPLDSDGSGFGALLTITDDGSGLDADAASGEGLGMRSMHFRAQAIGGELRIEDGPDGRGTQVRCLFDPETQSEGKADRDEVLAMD